MRQLKDVIDQILGVSTSEELNSVLNKVKRDISFTAPELMSERWDQAFYSLMEAYPNPLISDEALKICAIWSAKPVDVLREELELQKKQTQPKHERRRVIVIDGHHLGQDINRLKYISNELELEQPKLYGLEGLEFCLVVEKGVEDILNSVYIDELNEDEPFTYFINLCLTEPQNLSNETIETSRELGFGFDGTRDHTFKYKDIQFIVIDETE